MFGGHAAGLSWSLIAAILAALALILFAQLLRGRPDLEAARASGLYPPAGQVSDAGVLRLMVQGEKLLAIRLYREIYGGGLKRAREAVEKMAGDGG